MDLTRHHTRLRIATPGKETVSGGYGGPAFSPDRFLGDYARGEYLLYNSLYHEAQLAVDNVGPFIQSRFHCRPKDLLWFEDSLNPQKYTSGLTVESSWTEDLQNGIDYLADLIEYLEYVEGEPFDPTELAHLDRRTMDCIADLLWGFDYEKLRDDDYDRWGPYDWHPNEGEWSRCRDIVRDHEQYPVTVLMNGKMLDGAHRLAVAIYQHQIYYPCLVGFPPRIFQRSSR